MSSAAAICVSQLVSDKCKSLSRLKKQQQTDQMNFFLKANGNPSVRGNIIIMEFVWPGVAGRAPAGRSRRFPTSVTSPSPVFRAVYGRCLFCVLFIDNKDSVFCILSCDFALDC